MLFQLAADNPNKGAICKIPSMSEINYLNYISSARVGKAHAESGNTTLTRELNRCISTGDELNESMKSSTLAGNYSTNMGTNETDSPKEVGYNRNLYEVLDVYYQHCKFSPIFCEILLWYYKM